MALLNKTKRFSKDNLSLRLNGVGTYQLLKLLVTPGICILNYMILKELISLKRSLILVLVCVGIAIEQ